MSTSSSASHFISCLEKSVHSDEPYDHWLLDDALTEKVVEGIVNLPFLPPDDAIFEGSRENNNSKRVYFTVENQNKFPVCREVVNVFNDPAVIAALGKTTRTDLSKGQLRVEYCIDVDGFWLEPHADITVKMFTMLIYLSDDPQLLDAGTDIYGGPPEHHFVKSVPYQKNKGLIFIPADNTWHGFTKRPIKGLRKSIIINYVSPEWQNVYELAY